MRNIISRSLLVMIAILILSLFLSLGQVFAHPIDNTDLYIYYEKEADGLAIPENEMSAYLYINWYQAAALVQESTDKNALDLTMEELVGYNDIYNKYVRDHLKITNKGDNCELDFTNIDQDLTVYPLDLGKRIIMNFICRERVSELRISNQLFLDEFEYETNYVNLFKGEVFIDKVETNKAFNEFSINIKDDGSVDVEKPQNFISTDGAVSPLDPSYKNQKFDDSNSVMKTTTNTDYWSKLQVFFSNLKKIGNVNEMNPIYFLMILFVLGLLHTLEAGHSKIVLSSAMIHKNMSIKGGIMYAVIFTATHIGDILLLGVALLIVNNFIDVYSKFSLLERFAAYALLFIGVYLLFKSLAEYIQSKFNLEHDHTHNHDHRDGHSHSHDFDPNKSFKDQLVIGFLSGLAPCVFGWSILMVIVSAKKLWLLIPGILSFSLGIFSALVLVVLLIGKFKEKLLAKAGWFTDISPIISALILIVYAVYIIL